MIRRSLVASLVIASGALSHPAAAQSFDIAAAAGLPVAFLERSLSVSDSTLADMIRLPDQRRELLAGLFDADLDPAATPLWIKVLAWDGGTLLPGDSLLALWRSKKELVATSLASLEPAERQALAQRMEDARRAMEDFRGDRSDIRQAFRDLRDAYALCRGRHDESTRTLQEATFRLAWRAGELGDRLGELTLADRLWNAGGYELLSVGIAVMQDVRDAAEPPKVAEPQAEESVLQSLLPEKGLEGKAVSTLQ